jgi:hypothetical protein
MSICKAESVNSMVSESKRAPGHDEIDDAPKTILDICTLYTVYKNVLNPHLMAPATLRKTASHF